MCTYAKERRKPQKMSIASSRSRSCSIRNRRAISLQSVVSYNSSSSVPNAEIAHYISPMAITHSTSTYISTVQADDEICADHQVLNGHHNREYIHKLLTRISSSVYLFSPYMHISSIPRWDTTRVVLGCCCYSFICNTAGCKCITGRGVGIALFVCLKAIVLAGSFGSWCTLYIYV